jgi:DNA-binding transcriptional ArsR family regulator
MTPESDAAHEALERIFHEPSRLALMSALCATRDGLAFTELKNECRLTDGNLNRHLKTLEDAGVIRIEKKFVEAKPRTTVFITPLGLKRFDEYLGALSDVLDKARRALPATEAAPIPIGALRRARA